MTDTWSDEPECYGYHQCVGCGALTKEDIEGEHGWLCRDCAQDAEEER